MVFFIKNLKASSYMLPPDLGFTKATHYIMNYQRIYNQRTFRAEAYYKKYDDLIKQVPVGYNYYSYNNSGNGYAKGIDVFFRDKKTIKNLITG